LLNYSPYRSGLLEKLTIPHLSTVYGYENRKRGFVFDPFRYLYHIVYVTSALYHKYAILEQYASIFFNFGISFSIDISG
jgi:hypothetical protein